MAPTPHRRNMIDEVSRLKEEVRLLRIARRSNWTWYSLREYLCAGWIDPYADQPYRNTVEDAPQVLGYFDTGSSIIFTGVAYWDPNGWWATPPVPVGTPTGGDPDVSLDALEIMRPGYDAFQTFVGHGDEDAGRSIPYRIPDDQLLFLNFPVVHTSDLALAIGGSATRMMWGSIMVGLFSLAGADVEGFGNTGGTNFALLGGDRYMPEIAPPPVDALGFTHYSIPENTGIILHGQSFPYDVSIGRL